MTRDDTRDDHTIVASATANDTPSPERTDTMVNALIGRYRVVRLIGKGGMGEVMSAHDDQIGRDVAIKRMRAAAPTERQIQRFLREASIQGRLEHPAIVPVHEIGRDLEGLPFFAMKKITGTTLAKILHGDRTEFPLQRILRAFAEVCLAVELAHVRGIVHRDLKPDNIILGDFGEVYVIDWGVAKVLGEEDGEFADVGSGSGEHATVVGTAIGTGGYMAPEQVRGETTIDGRADIYTLGCLLFEILAGQPLHPPGPPGLTSAVAGRDSRPSVRTPGAEIPPELDALCVHATALEPEERIRTARELGDRVLRFLDGDRDLAQRRQLARDHLERATTAFAAGDGEEHRSTAMREAAGALALDPTLAGAAALVGRLMLEPPEATPREVDEVIAAADVRAAKYIARAGVWTLVAAALFAPLVWWMAPSASGYIAIFTGVLAINGAISLHANRTARPRPGLVLLGNTLLIAVIARMFSPVLIAPGIAAALAMAMALTPRFSIFGSAATIAVLLISAIVVPLVLEWVGILSSSISVVPHGVLFRAPVVGESTVPTQVVSVVYIAALITNACVMAHTMRSRTRTAHRRLQLQAWQLRQLVPR